MVFIYMHISAKSFLGYFFPIHLRYTVYYFILLYCRFGLKNVSTTSKASGNNNRSSSKNNTLPSNNRSTATGNKFPLKTSSRMNTASGKNKSGTSSLPHLKKGYNGLGGQSKVLCIPKKTSSGFKKPAPVSLKQEHRKMIKVSRNNPTISKFLNKAPKLPTIQLSP